MKRLLAIVGTIVALYAMPAGAQIAPDEQNAISGVVTIHSGFHKAKAVRNDDGTCSGTGLRSDVLVGARVVVTDEGSNVIGTTTLDAGRVARLVKRGKKAKFDCKFSFRTGALPDSDEYWIGIGKLWGGAELSRSEIDARGWVVEITV